MNPLFKDTGAHVLVDGQFGSTGKGALAAYLAGYANLYKHHIDLVVSNAGPNSGHTFYHEGEKHVLKQLPTFAVASHLLGKTIPIFLSAGAVIDLGILCKEADKYGIPVTVHPNAAVITDQDKESEHSGTIAAVAGTRSGTGAALVRKLQRDPEAIMRSVPNFTIGSRNVRVADVKVNARSKAIFVEVSQGFSLGINSRFYPKVTSRECTAAQALADARIPPSRIATTYMCCRTFPIRVGNVDGHSSGDCYPDQAETTWEAIGQAPELTTVTQRVRRVFEWSWMQFEEALEANEPDFVFLNFLNYMSRNEQMAFIQQHIRSREDLARGKGIKRYDLIGGFGPEPEDVRFV